MASFAGLIKNYNKRNLTLAAERFIFTPNIKTMYEALGLIAGAMTTISFVPQVYKTWKSRSSGDLSMGMLLVFFIGVILWLIYGILINSLPIIVTNSVTFFLTGCLVVFKFKFK